MDTYNKSMGAVANEGFVLQLTGHKREGWDGIIHVKPMTPGTFFAVNAVLEQIKEDEDPKKYVLSNYNKVMNIICLAWHNQKGDYPNWYRDVLDYAIEDMAQLFEIVKKIVEMMNFKSFMMSTTLLQAMGLKKK